jgi:hypothetical protein
MVESRQDQVHRLAQEIIWIADHQPYPHPDPRVHALAVEIQRLADEKGRKENRRPSAARAVSGDNVVSFPGPRR